MNKMLQTEFEMCSADWEPDQETRAVERDITMLHAQAIDTLLARASIDHSTVGVVGFHGHTLHHEPSRGFTWQIGDGELLAAKSGIDVVADFRSADVMMAARERR